ncbi:hypothetical protein FJTKL_02727 [Diaporthe vaccinii]|uniref:Secreted protein n=1 Tax=Diaporthe vaccinii TaxID=105482 RepID=A0ABR4DWQ7_9PEZI
MVRVTSCRERPKGDYQCLSILFAALVWVSISAAAHGYPASPAVLAPLACPGLVLRRRTLWVCVHETDALVFSFVGRDCISGMADASERALPFSSCPKTSTRVLSSSNDHPNATAAAV